MVATGTFTTTITTGIIMGDSENHLPALALLRLQSWLSPAFPTGSYSYSHGLEWAVRANASEIAALALERGVAAS